MNETSVIALRILSYDLPDAHLLEPGSEPARCVVFVPPRVMVVIGRGSDPARELISANIVDDDVPVFRRASGGCAVVLSPDMLAVSFALYTEAQKKSSEYFHAFNSLIMHALERQQVSGLALAGTSDIALHGRKISGSSIYRNRALVFYHAIINVAGDARLMERYLARPPREPDYRTGRTHADFVTSLQDGGFTLDRRAFGRDLEADFQSTLRR